MVRPVDDLTDADVIERIASVGRWYHAIEFRPGLVTPGVNNAGLVLAHLDLPDDCRGLRALDIGARDGYFTFELERRGATVVALDYARDTETGFRVAADLLRSTAEFVHGNVYELAPERFGHFDIVLFLGVIYHLPDPLEALHRVRSVSRGHLCLESHVIDRALTLGDGTTRSLHAISPLLDEVPLMQFYPGRTLNNDPTNYWGPNLACLRALLREALFEPVSSHLLGARGVVNARAIEDRPLATLNALARGRHPPAA
jgi:tRNA (mo5U34)-methyltransferase